MYFGGIADLTLGLMHAQQAPYLWVRIMYNVKKPKNPDKVNVCMRVSQAGGWFSDAHSTHHISFHKDHAMECGVAR